MMPETEQIPPRTHVLLKEGVKLCGIDTGRELYTPAEGEVVPLCGACAMAVDIVVGRCEAWLADGVSHGNSLEPRPSESLALLKRSEWSLLADMAVLPDAEVQVDDWGSPPSILARPSS